MKLQILIVLSINFVLVHSDCYTPVRFLGVEKGKVGGTDGSPNFNFSAEYRAIKAAQREADRIANERRHAGATIIRKRVFECLLDLLAKIIIPKKLTLENSRKLINQLKPIIETLEKLEKIFPGRFRGYINQLNNLAEALKKRDVAGALKIYREIYVMLFKAYLVYNVIIPLAETSFMNFKSRVIKATPPGFVPDVFKIMKQETKTNDFIAGLDYLQLTGRIIADDPWRIKTENTILVDWMFGGR